MAYSPNGTKQKSKFYEDETSYLPVVSEGTRKKNWKDVLLQIATAFIFLLVVAFVVWMVFVVIPTMQQGW